MKHAEVTKKWYWYNVDYDGSFWFQCVDWVRQYCKERWYPIESFLGSAIMWWDTWHPFDKTWKRIEYTWLNSPSEGDIIFWSEKRCKYGHTAVANRFCNPFLLRYSDQNGTWNGDVIQPRWSSYKNMLWWYHKTQK